MLLLKNNLLKKIKMLFPGQTEEVYKNLLKFFALLQKIGLNLEQICALFSNGTISTSNFKSGFDLQSLISIALQKYGLSYSHSNLNLKKFVKLMKIKKLLNELKRLFPDLDEESLKAICKNLLKYGSTLNLNELIMALRKSPEFQKKIASARIEEYPEIIDGFVRTTFPKARKTESTNKNSNSKQKRSQTDSKNQESEEEKLEKRQTNMRKAMEYFSVNLSFFSSPIALLMLSFALSKSMVAVITDIMLSQKLSEFQKLENLEKFLNCLTQNDLENLTKTIETLMPKQTQYSQTRQYGDIKQELFDARVLTNFDAITEKTSYGRFSNKAGLISFSTVKQGEERCHFKMG